MAYEVTMPRLGWTMEEGVLGEWLKQDGDAVQAGDLLFTVEGDKATQEVEALESGILRLPPNAPGAGDVIPVGALLAYIAQADEHPQWASETPGVRDQAAVTSEPPVRSYRPQSPAISPRARRVAGELGVDWTQVQGSGRTGRILERDVRAAAAKAKEEVAVRATPLAQRMAAAAGIDLASVPPSTPAGRIQRQDVEAVIAKTEGPGERTPSQRIPHSRIRQITAQRMHESTLTTAPVTLTSEADASELVILRQQFKDSYSRRKLSVPSYNDLFLKLVAVALQEHPALNASWSDEGITLHTQIHIGFAVDTEKGLLVPVLHNVEAKSLRQIAVQSQELIERAQAQHLKAAQMQGGTFTLTNLGMYGIDAFTPIINLPQAAILGIGRINSKPAVHNGQIVPRDMIALSLTFDHRLVDGGPAARFLNTVREYVEEPLLWLPG